MVRLKPLANRLCVSEAKEDTFRKSNFFRRRVPQLAFDTPQPPLSDYLEWTTTGKLQLPDFQREWTWEDERIRSLLVTVLRGHPMGAVMLLETGTDLIRFKPKPIAGTKPPAGTEPTRLFLDGQQRLTWVGSAHRNR